MMIEAFMENPSVKDFLYKKLTEDEPPGRGAKIY
jgi:hypothetical protein